VFISGKFLGFSEGRNKAHSKYQVPSFPANC
jgi:hypothetical protein